MEKTKIMVEENHHFASDHLAFILLFAGDWSG